MELALELVDSLASELGLDLSEHSNQQYQNFRRVAGDMESSDIEALDKKDELDWAFDLISEAYVLNHYIHNPKNFLEDSPLIPDNAKADLRSRMETRAEERTLNLHLDEPDEFDFQCGDIHLTYLCLIRLIPYHLVDEVVPGNLYQLGPGCDAWTSFPVDAFLNMLKYVTKLIETGLDVICQGSSLILGVRPVACAASAAASAATLIIEANIRRGDHADAYYHEQLTHFMKVQVDDIHRFVKCKENVNPSFNRQGCNGQDDNCVDGADEVEEDQVAPIVNIPYATDMGWIRNDDKAIDALNTSDLCTDDCYVASHDVVLDSASGECMDRSFEAKCADRAGNEAEPTFVNLWVDRYIPSIECSVNGKEAYIDDSPVNGEYIDANFDFKITEDCGLSSVHVTVSHTENPLHDLEETPYAIYEENLEDAETPFNIYLKLQTDGSFKWYRVRVTACDLEGECGTCTAHYGIHRTGQQEPSLTSWMNPSYEFYHAYDKDVTPLPGFVHPGNLDA